MRYGILLLVSLLLFAWCPASAQNKMEEVLRAVAGNSKAIMANQQYWEARKVAFKTGLTPPNPSLEYDYLKGRPEGAGNQVDFAVTQSFDFPTSYFKKRQLAEEQIAQTAFQAIAFRQDILLEAKLYYLELVSLNKQNQLLTNRLENIEKLLKDYQRKFELGDANILDVNKAKVQAVSLRTELRSNESQIRQFSERLIKLNGGIPLAVNDTTYPPLPEVPVYSVMDSLIEANDPLLKTFLKEREISIKEKAVTKALSLPKLEAGYRSQAILGQVYEGIHAGITVPLWQDRNKVKQVQAGILYNEMQIQHHRTAHLHEIRELYQRYETLKVSVAEYEELLETLNNTALLDKALNLGQISTIEYFMELTYFYTSYDTYLELEKEYRQVIAELFKFTL